MQQGNFLYQILIHSFSSTQGTIRTAHTTHAAALKTTTHPKTRYRKPYAATLTSSAPDDGRYVPETRRAKNTLIKLPCCIKLAFQIISVRSERIFKSLRHSTLYWINQHTLRIKSTHNIINNSHLCSQSGVTCLKPNVDQPHNTASRPPVSTPNKDTIMYNAASKFFLQSNTDSYVCSDLRATHPSPLSCQEARHLYPRTCISALIS